MLQELKYEQLSKQLEQERQTLAHQLQQVSTYYCGSMFSYTAIEEIGLYHRPRIVAWFTTDSAKWNTTAKREFYELDGYPFSSRF